jgi:hypothetical protein
MSAREHHATTTPDRAGPGRAVQAAVEAFTACPVPDGIGHALPHLHDATRLLDALAPGGSRYQREQAVLQEFLIRAELRLEATFNDSDRIGRLLSFAHDRLAEEFPVRN